MFTTTFKKYACEGDTITCGVDGYTITARIVRDDCQDAPDERQDGFWPSRDEKDAGYVPPGSFDIQQAKAEEAMLRHSGALNATTHIPPTTAISATWRTSF